MEIIFKGKTALVSGAGKGIGNAIATKLFQCGANVIALDKNTQDLDSLKKKIPSIQTISVDLCDWSATRESLKNVSNIDLLVNNAGTAILEPITAIPEHHIDQTFAINFKAVVNLTQIVTKNLLQRKMPGAIVNISSKASFRGLQDHGVYCSTKAAVDAFTKVSAVEFGKYGIRVNCVNPTVVLTELGRQFWSDPDKANALKEKIALKRFAEVEEVVNAVIFLLSDKASMITGSCLPIDGGCLAIL